MKLYEIDAEIRFFLDRLYAEADEDGVVSDDAFERLEELKEERQTKLENVALYFKELQAEADAIKAEAEKLSKRAKTAQARADNIKAYLSNSMQKNGETEVETARCRITFRKSEKVVVDEAKLSKEYMVEKVEWTPDKKKLKELLKNGTQIDGATIQVNQNIQIS